MTTTSTKRARKTAGGFTLVELMVSVLIFSVVIASILSTFVAFAKSATSVGFYSEMSSASRKALELFSRDVRSASGITVASAMVEDGYVISNDGITLSYPSYIGVTKAVQYSYSSADDELTRTVTLNGTSTSSVLLNGLETFKLTFFQTPGGSFVAESGAVASVDTWTKSIQMDAELVRNVMAIQNTDYIISARFMLRNYNNN